MSDSAIYRDIEKIRSVLEALSSSGLTQVRFCAENDLPPWRFQYWRRIYLRSQIASQAGESFIPVRITKRAAVKAAESIQRENALEIIWPDGKRFVFQRLPDAGWLEALLN